MGPDAAGPYHLVAFFCGDSFTSGALGDNAMTLKVRDNVLIGNVARREVDSMEPVLKFRNWRSVVSRIDWPWESLCRILCFKMGSTTLASGFSGTMMRFVWAFCLSGLMAGGQPCLAATLTVTSTSNVGQGSLRQAILDAEVGDTILFDEGLSGLAIAVSGEDLRLAKDVQIDGSGLASPVTIASNRNMAPVPGEPPSRLFSILEGITAELTGLILAHGEADWDGIGASEYAGGAVYNEGNLTMTGCTVLECSSPIGGGVYNASTGDLEIEASCFVANSAVSGAAVFNAGGSVRLLNSTCSGLIGGALETTGGSLLVRHCTVTGNDCFSVGAIHVRAGECHVDHSIVAGNNGFVFPPSLFSNLTGPVTTMTNSLTAGDPMLFPLGNYGGSTATNPPMPGSLAIDGGGSSGVTVDQRGMPRGSSAVVDIGAVEIQGHADMVAILSAVWPADADDDKAAFGLEWALGMNWTTKDFLSPRRFQIVGTNGSGAPKLTFGVNPAASSFTSWSVKRSTTLTPGSFSEIYRLDGPAMSGTDGDVEAFLNGDLMEVTDLNAPAGGAFYLLESILVPDSGM